MIRNTVMIVAGLLILFGSFSKSWWTAEVGGQSMSMGLTSLEVCAEGMCQSADISGMLRQFGGSVGIWSVFTQLSKWGGIALGLFLFVCAGLRFTQNESPVDYLPKAAGALLVCGLAVLFMKPAGLGTGMFSTGIALYAFFVGTLAAIGSVFVPDEETSWKGTSGTTTAVRETAGVAVPLGAERSCPSCGQAARYIESQKEYFCDPCTIFLD